MLQQILQDMFIDPELLAELSDEQKHVLFVKMREEQVRRWQVEEEKREKQEKRAPRRPKKGKKNVGFLKGRDGNDWVWVMGDHPDDKTVDEILEQEAQQKALEEAEKELANLRIKEEEELKKKLAEEQRRLEEEKKQREEEIRRREEEAALYQSLKEAKIAAQKLDEEKRRTQENERKRIEELRNSFAIEKRQSLEKVEKAKRRRSSELYTMWKEMRKQIEKSAEEGSKEVDKNWQEQEKRAKKAQEQLRNLAKRAREEHRNSLRASVLGEKPPLPPKPKSLAQNNNITPNQNGTTAPNVRITRKRRTPRPTCKEAVVNWFLEEEKPQGVGIDPATKKVAPWFHGVISRVDAEKQLLTKTLGTFLVRVSERVWGYTISYRAEDRCKHFLIDTSEVGYQFFGDNQVPHASLHDLIIFHKTHPITVMGKEKLLNPCGQEKDPPDYMELLGRVTESTAL